MKRFAPLFLVVLALAAAVPVVALADDTTPTTPPATTTTTTTDPSQQGKDGHPFARMRLELLQLRLQLVRLEYRVVCHNGQSDACTQFTTKLVDRLTTLDKNVQAKIASNNCTSASTDKKCTVLGKVDQRLQQVIAKLGSPSGSSSSSDSSSDSSLDAAAGQLGGLVGATKP